MNVIQSQLINYTYQQHVQKHIRLIRWWLLDGSEEGKEKAIPFTGEQENILISFMDDHPQNFPKDKREMIDAKNLVSPLMGFEDLESDVEKPCLLLIRSKPIIREESICRRMDIVLMNDELPVQLPFDIAGEVILEKA